MTVPLDDSTAGLEYKPTMPKRRRKPKSSTRTKRAEKVALYITHESLAALRKLKDTVGIPNSVAINKAIEEYLRRREE